MEGVGLSTHNEGPTIRQQLAGADVVVSETLETVKGSLHQPRPMVQVPHLHTTLPRQTVYLNACFGASVKRDFL